MMTYISNVDNHFKIWNLIVRHKLKNDGLNCGHLFVSGLKYCHYPFCGHIIVFHKDKILILICQKYELKI